MKLSTEFSEDNRELWLQISRNPAWEPFSFVERVVRVIYEHRLCNGDVVIDGGANRGMHTLPLSEKVGESGRVIAVEANPFLASRIENFVQEHQIKNIEVISKALGAKDGFTDFNIAKNCDPLSGIRRRPDLVDQIVDVVQVPLIRLDTIVSNLNLPNIRFIKLDLEGGEYDALCGAQQILQANEGPLIILENGRQWSGDLYGFTKDAWFSLFEKNGYKVFDLFGYPFSRGAWDMPEMCWYSIAAKTTEDVRFVESDLEPLMHIVYDNMPPVGQTPWSTQKFKYAYI
ncbi:MAG: FkbM family methyltransferase [Alphaproteobacteria bacterium]